MEDAKEVSGGEVQASCERDERGSGSCTPPPVRDERVRRGCAGEWVGVTGEEGELLLPAVENCNMGVCLQEIGRGWRQECGDVGSRKLNCCCMHASAWAGTSPCRFPLMCMRMWREGGAPCCMETSGDHELGIMCACMRGGGLLVSCTPPRWGLWH